MRDVPLKFEGDSPKLKESEQRRARGVLGKWGSSALNNKLLSYTGIYGRLLLLYVCVHCMRLILEYIYFRFKVLNKNCILKYEKVL